jgi:hypothetical protein
MNNTKVAVLFGNKRNHNYYLNNRLGIIEAFMKLPKNFQTQFFAMTDVMNAYEREGRVTWFVNTVKAMKFAINERFEPDVVFCVGDPNYEWDKVLVGKYRKYFIYDSYEEPKKFFDWDNIIVPTFEDLIFFPKAMVGAVYNDLIFKDNKRELKPFQIFYPQLIQNLDLFLDIQHDDLVVGMNDRENILLLSDMSTPMIADIVNQSKSVVLIEKENDIELALSALACNVPVLTVEDNKSSFLDGVFVSLATTPDFLVALNDIKSISMDTDLTQYTTSAFAKKVRELL